MTTAEHEAHRRFLNAYYRPVKHVYDVTRKYYLLGRDRVLRELLEEPWGSLIEVGPGTGRNLMQLHRARADARYGAVEASDEMLAMVRERCPWARCQHGFAEDVDYSRVLGQRPDRILFSYCLSMVQDGGRALDNARRALAPGGELVVIDFGDLGRRPLLARAMSRFLAAFHVEAPAHALLCEHEACIRWGVGRYYLVARMKPLQ